MHNKIRFLICHLYSCQRMETACWFIKSYFYTDHLSPECIHKSCRYAYIPPLIVDVEFVVLGFTYKYWGYVLIKFGI